MSKELDRGIWSLGNEVVHVPNINRRAALSMLDAGVYRTSLKSIGVLHIIDDLFVAKP